MKFALMFYNLFLSFFQWRNQCCEVGAVYSASQNDSSCTEFSENIIANIKETQCRQNTDYCFEENTFFDMTVTTQPSVVIVLPPNSSKSIFVKLVTVKEARMSKSSKRLLLLQIRQRFKSLRWCLLGRHGLRLGYISKNFLSNKAMSKLSDALISPTVEFVSESINLVPQSQNADIAAMAQKTYQLSLPTGYIDSSINATVFASFRLSSVPINTRTFYNFVMKVRFGEHKQSTLGSTRYLELATIVFEGHHVGVTQLGPGVGSAAGTRLGANYILPVISVDHIPATVAATSSSAIGDGKSIALLEVGVPHHIQDGAQKRCGNLATIQVSESLAGPIQSHMACAGVLISGQLRRVFDVSNSSNQHSVVEHAVKLCFTNSGKYTIYILARELQPAHFKSSSITDLSENCRWLASPWLLDSSPVLLSVGGQK